MYCQLLIPVVMEICGRVGVDEYRVKAQKERRIIEALEPVMSSHRLVMDRRAICQEDNQKQMTRIFDKKGALPKDDRVDVLAATVSHWEDMLSTDVDLIIQRNNEHERRKVAKSWTDDNRRMKLWGEHISGAVTGKPVVPVNNKWSVRGRRIR
jgi:hypothetical protein